MIKLKSVFAIFLATLFIFSCSKGGDDSASPVQAELAGSWRVTSYYFDGQVSTLFQEDFTYYNYTGNAGKMNLTMVFSEQPQDYSFSGFYFLDNTITTDEGDFYEFTDYHTVDDQGAWNMANNTITISMNDEDINVGISQLSESTLVLRVNTNTSETAQDNITVTNTSKHETYVLERIN